MNSPLNKLGLIVAGTLALIAFLFVFLLTPAATAPAHHSPEISPQTVYTLTLQKVGPGIITPTAGIYTYTTPTVITLTAAAAANSAFADWTGTHYSAYPTFTLLVDGPTTLTATFFPDHGHRTWITRTQTDGISNTFLYAVEAYNNLIFAGVYPFTGFAAAFSVSRNGGLTFTTHPAGEAGLGIDTALGFYIADENTIYAATWSGLGISHNGGVTFTNHPITNSQGSAPVTDVYVADGKIYATTSGSGLAIFSNDGLTFTTRITANSGLGDNNLFCVFAEGQNVYVGTVSGGLSISHNGGLTFTNRTTENGLGSNGIYHLYVDGQNIYTANGNSLSISHDGGETFFTRTVDNGLGKGSVEAIYANGPMVYVGSSEGIAISYNGGRTFTLDNETTGMLPVVLDIYVNNGIIYAATSTGLAYSLPPAVYTLTLATTGPGTLAPAAGTYTYTAGWPITLIATPTTSLTTPVIFNGWSGDIISTGNPLTFLLDTNKTITGTFASLDKSLYLPLIHRKAAPPKH